MAQSRRCALIGAPVEHGVEQRGCLMGPDAYRTAGIAEALGSLGFNVSDSGNAVPGPDWTEVHPNPALKHLGRIAAWTDALHVAVYETSSEAQTFPIIMGGDHSLAMGALSALSRRAKAQGRPLFLLWLDAHPDIHTLDTTTSGNLHGVPISYLIGAPGFEDWLPSNLFPIDPKRICMMGIRSVDPAESEALKRHLITVHDMRALDEHGVVPLLRPFLEQVKRENGLLHVTLDVDFLDPEIAPGVNTTVPGGATFREAHLIMEMVHDSGLASSLDMVELNPFLDDRGRTAKLMVDLAASLMGRQVLDRPTRSY
ncbi:MAG: arginase [Rhodobacteraceae bacterium]|nr:arginase [Paracoccaceae bacterium]